MHIVWDEPKRLTNLRKHRLDFIVLTEGWFDDATFFSARGSRRKAIGWLNGKVVAVIVQPLGTEALSIISFRLAKTKERGLIQ